MRVQRLKGLMLGVLMLSLGMFGFARADLAGYIIDQYQADFVLQSDGVLAVEEDIEVYFWEQRHGIYRDIPILHATNKNHQIKTPIEAVNVENKSFSISENEGLFRIKIGSPDFKVSWKQGYPLRYQVRGAVRQFSGYQELYRNMLGTERNTEIRNFNFHLTLPEGVELGTGDFYAVKGVKGAIERLELKKEGNQISPLVPLDLGAREGVTISVTLPDGTVPVEEFVVEDHDEGGFDNAVLGLIEDSPSGEWILLGSWILVFLLVLLGPIIFLGVLLYLWFKKWVLKNKETIETLFAKKEKRGTVNVNLSQSEIKDIKAKITQFEKAHKVVHQAWAQYQKKDLKKVIYYDLPKGYSPAEVSQIYADGLTWEALSATLCDWQVKGYIEIVSTKEFFSVGTKINKKKEMGEDFPPFEQWLWRYFKLDKNGYWDSEKFRSMASTFDLLEAMLSSLLKQYQNVLYVSTDFVRIKIAGIQRLSYSESGQKNESIFVFLCLFLFFIVFAVVIVREWSLEFFFWLSLVFSPRFFMFGSLLFAKSKIYYTEQGKSVKEQIIGFRKYLQTVEQEKLDHLLREDPSYFEKVLPYAIALGVGKEWVKRCKAMIASLEYQVMDTDATLVVSDSLSRSMSRSSPSSSSSGDSSFGSSSSSSGGGSSGGGWWGWGGGGW